MSDEERDRWLARVRKLLAKAEDPASTPAEAEALTAKATALIAKYGIDQARLAMSEPASNMVGGRIFDIPGPYANHKLVLLYGIARAFGCDGVKLRGPARGDVRLHLFGLESDLQRAELLYTSLLVQEANALLTAEAKDRARSVGSAVQRTRGFRADFHVGFNTVVIDRVTAAEARARRDADMQTRVGEPRMDLVLASRATLVTRAVDDAYPDRTRGRRSRLRRVGAGYGQGREAGTRADIGGERLTGETTARQVTGP